MARMPAICLTLPLLLLSACQGEEPAPTAATAGGEILPASISDEMLPFDTVRSQPPLAPRPAASGKDGEAEEAGAEEKPESGEGPTPAASAAPAPAPVTPNAG